MIVGLSADDILRGQLPETTPADTPAKKASEPAPGGETRTYAGKYNSPEELEAAYTEVQRKLGEQGDELGRMRALLVEPQVPYTQPAREPGYPAGVADPSLGEFVTREEAQRLADERFDVRMRTRDAQAQQQQWYSTQQQRLREDFFARYPDLQKQQRLVKAIAEEFQGKYGHLDVPRFLTLWPSIAKELADAAYADIAALKADAKAEFERSAADRAAGQPAGTAGTAAPTPSARPAPTTEELRQEAIRDEADRYHAARRPPSRA